MTAAQIARAETVALVPLLGSGLGADELADDEKLVRAEVDAHFGKKSIPAATVQTRMAEAVQIGLRCDRSTIVCLVQLGVVCKADRVLLAIVTPAATRDDTGQLAFRLVDVGAATQIAYASRSIQGAPRAPDVSALLGALELPSARALSVDVRGPTGVHVLIDGAERAVLPLHAPLTDVAAGKHELRLISADATDVVAIDVRAGEPVVVDVPHHSTTTTTTPLATTDLTTTPATPPPTASLPMSTILVTAGGVVAAAGVVGVVVGSLPFFEHEGAVDELNRLDATVGTSAAKLRDNAPAIRDARERLDASADDWNTWGLATVIGGSVAVVVGAGVAAGAFFIE